MAGFSPEDFDYAVRTVWGEARGEPTLGQQSVAAVIRNRARAAGTGFKNVVLARNQFEPWGSKRDQLMGLSPQSPEYQRIAETIRPILESDADPTKGATHFYSPKVQAALGRKPPSWDNGTGFEIGTHRFFKLGAPTSAAPPSPASAPITTGSNTGSPPMADFSTAGLSPEEVALRRRQGQYAYQQGTDASPVGHWTQALARVVQGANAGVWNSQAQEGEAQGRATANKALTEALMSPSPQAAIARGLQTPYGQEMFGPMASGIVQQRIADQGEGAQAKLAALRAETKAKEAEANKAGFMPFQPGTGIVDISRGKPEVVVQGGVKPPPGYEMDPMSPGAMRPIPGGPADIKFTEKRHQALTQVESARQRTNDLTADIDAVIKHPGLKGNFGLKGALPNMYGSQAADAWQLIQQLKARGSFQILQNMREMSKTGGALGAVSDSENRKLESAFAALEKAQSPEQTVRELIKVQKQIKQSQALLDLAYQREYGDKGSPAQVPTRNAPAEINTQDILKQAKRAADGKMYVPDPDRPGKFLRVDE
jgi:hypothetical protein